MMITDPVTKIRNAAPTTTEIGKLISLPGGESPSYQQMHVRLDHKSASPMPGAWVAVDVEHGIYSGQILCRVVNTWEVNPHEDPQGSVINAVLPFDTVYAPEGESTVIFRVAELEPMEEATTNGEGPLITEVKSLPRAGASVWMAEQSLVTAALGLAAEPEVGLEVGTLRGTDTPVVLKRDIVQRHIFIGGGIGAGKSYTRGVLAEELAMHGVPQINIDVNGEMIKATEQLGGINLTPGKKGFTLPLSSLTPQDVVNALPGMRSGTNYETLIIYAHEALLKERTLSCGEHFTVADLVAKIGEVAPQLDMDKAATLKPAKQRASSLELIPYIGEPFPWEKHIKPGAVINIDCRGLLVSDLRLIVASVARDLQRIAQRKDNLFVAFSIDEFHLVAPKDDASVTTQVLREIARIGRHYKIGLILTTQSPQDVDRAILKRLLTRFLHAIESDQLDALRGVFSDASDTLVRSLSKLPQGACVVTGSFETVRHAVVIDVRTRTTKHGGETPDIWSDFSHQGWASKQKLALKGGRP